MKLANGIKKFSDAVYPQMEGHFAQLKSGQSPETLFITCSDSRIDPHLVTQSEPGELFVIRNAGNIVPKPGDGELGVEATIEYAVKVLKVSQIVVCGHSLCGAVTGLIHIDSLNELPVIRDWVLRSEKVLERISEPSNVDEAIKANVLLQLEHLKEFECVKEALSNNALSLHGWVYHFEKGQVEFLTSETEVSG